MGQKVNPCSFRIGSSLYKAWNSVFYAKKDYSIKVLEDLKIRSLINKKYKLAQVSRTLIQRTATSLVINIYAKKPGVIIGKSGSDISNFKKDVGLIVKADVFINIHEIKKSFLDASAVAQSIAQQLENRISFRKSMKNAIQNCFKQGGKGMKVCCSGRLGGTEIARVEWYIEGKMPLHTLKSDIDYAFYKAVTSFGVIGVKVWIYKGESLKYRRRVII